MKKNELEITMKLDGEDFLYADVEIDFGMFMKKLLQMAGQEPITEMKISQKTKESNVDRRPDDFAEHMKATEPRLKEVVNGNTVSRYTEDDRIVETERTTTDENGDTVVIYIKYDDQQRTSKFVKYINGVPTVQKNYTYDRYGSVVEFSYSSKYPNGKVRTSVCRTYMNGTVYETVIPTGNASGLPIKNEYPGCYLNKVGNPIHEITGIQINSENARYIL